MKPDKHFAVATCTVMAAAGLIALTWVGTVRAVGAQRAETTVRVTATLANQALAFSEQINRQLLALDQTLRTLAASWEADPGQFDLEASRRRTVVLRGLSRDMVVTDENGIIRQSSVNEAIGQNASGQDYFRALADPPAAGGQPQPQPQPQPGEDLFIGPPTIDGIMRQWHMNVARALHFPDGSFAGVIDTDYRLATITDLFAATDLGPGAFMALAGLDDGRLRGAVGGTSVSPDASVGDTPMFAAIRTTDSGIWTGPSANDAVQRIHAFRRIPGRNLAVVVAMEQDAALRPATVWREDADFYAGCITALLAGLALVVVQATRRARRRDAEMADARATLAAANAHSEVARALAEAKTEQLEAILSGMNDGVAIVDAHMCLAEWNARFAEVAGVPADILRVGLPMEEILRTQIRTGRFGPVIDQEKEVKRRMARLHAARSGVTEEQLPGGHTLELRRSRLPDGGFITLYADITERNRVEAELHEARQAAEAANIGQSRFAAIVGRTRPAAQIQAAPDNQLDVARDHDLVDAARDHDLVDAARDHDLVDAARDHDLHDATGEHDRLDPAGEQDLPDATGDHRGASLTRRRPPRTRILLAEEIEADQRAIATMLRRAGHHVDIATIGPAAIRAIQTAPYDLVLVDAFMPDMRGQEATQIMRSLPEPAGSIPIIALTGDVAPQDEARFRATGMNGLLGKPVSLAKLLDTIDRHVWSATEPAAGSAGLAGPAGDPDVSGMIPVLAEARINELRSNLPPAVFANLIEECLADMDHRLPALRRALAAGAPAAITAHAHALVGMASSYGMTALEARLRTIIDAARELDVASFGPAMVAGLQSDFAQAARTLRQILRSQAA
jgi:CheY-like chemotaxis protein/PAS domain-containing protein